jgi:hypothetical protein
MSRARTSTSLLNAARACLLAAAAFAFTAPAVAEDEEVAPVAEDTPVEIATRAEASTSDLAGSIRSLEGALSAAPAAAPQGRALTAAEHSALVEAGIKAQLAGLADELDLLSAALASDADPEMQKVLLRSVTRRAAALSRLAARPAQVEIPSELQADLLALWSDVEALSASLNAAPQPSRRRNRPESSAHSRRPPC